MIETPHLTGRMLLVLTIVGLIGAGQISRAQEPEEPDANAPANPLPLVVLNDTQFERWAFGDGMTPDRVRSNLESLLTMQIEEIDRSCTLTKDQKNKLRLAGRGDMKRFLDRVEETRSLLKALKVDDAGINEIYLKIRPMQGTLRSGLFNEGSIYFRTIGNTLTTEQSARHDRAVQEKKAFLYQAKVEVLVARLSNSLALTSEQREQLVKLVLEETRPPRKSGQLEDPVVLFQMASLPEASVKAIFDDAQWRALRPVLAQWRGREKLLRTNGYVPDNAGPVRDANPAEPTAKKND